jgi:acyl carrier protein phosphodiesterase
MNWLAHLVLSDPIPAFRVGNVLADILPIGELRALPEPFQAGIARHRAIDSFTDKHPVFRRSVARLDATYRRYGGVIVDIFYDHLLTQQWSEHGSAHLQDFVAGFHDDVERVRRDIPPGAYSILHRMKTGAWLTSYGDVDGVRITLNRISKRLRRPFDLGGAAIQLQLHAPAFAQDFAEFFPLIRSHFFADKSTPAQPLPE